jgi:hypothetical protein
MNYFIKPHNKFKILLASFFIIFLGSTLWAYSFSEPNQMPPLSNKVSPLTTGNTGQTPQVKLGNLGLNLGRAGTGLIVRGGANMGRVGIGTVNPQEKLALVGNFFISGLIKPNNIAGAAGQVLTLGLPGTMKWDATYEWLSLVSEVSGKPPSCGNNVCQNFLGETCSTCPFDCGCAGGLICWQGKCTQNPGVGGGSGFCGDGICQAINGTGMFESCETCSLDCGTCQGTCGNGQIEWQSGEQCDGGQGICTPGAEICAGCRCVNILFPTKPPPPPPNHCQFILDDPSNPLGGGQCGGPCPVGQLCEPFGTQGCACTSSDTSLPISSPIAETRTILDRVIKGTNLTASAFPGIKIAEAQSACTSVVAPLPCPLGWQEYNLVCAALSDSTPLWVRNCYQ